MEQLKVSLNDFLAGQEIRFEAQHKDMYHTCRYKIGGKWIWAKICFENQTVIVNGQAIKRGVRV